MESRNQDDEQEMTEDAPGVTAEVLKAALCRKSRKKNRRKKR